VPTTEPTWQQVVAALEQASSAHGRRRLGASIAEGWRLLERALSAGVLPSAVLISERAGQSSSGNEQRVLALLRQADVPCVVAPKSVVQRLTSGRTFGDLLGLVPTVDHGLAALLEAASQSTDARSDQLATQSLLVGVQVLDPGNIGALTRSAHALGSVGVVWVGGTDPRHPKALRASMGSCFCVPWTHVRDDSATIQATLTAAGWRNIATVTQGGAPLPAELQGRCAIWMGGEAHGLTAAVVTGCHAAVSIPTAAAIDSLSINAAAAIVLSRINSLKAL